jgi:hypothetical protein
MVYKESAIQDNKPEILMRDITVKVPSYYIPVRVHGTGWDGKEIEEVIHVKPSLLQRIMLRIRKTIPTSRSPTSSGLHHWMRLLRSRQTAKSEIIKGGKELRKIPAKVKKLRLNKKKPINWRGFLK